MKPTSLQDFYEQTLSVSPDDIAAQMGHFNVFQVKDLNKLRPADAAMFYNRKSFFKIALLVLLSMKFSIFHRCRSCFFPEHSYKI